MYWAVVREPGPAWDTSRPLREQERWAEHREFMDELVDEGLVVLGGPVAGGTSFLLLCQGPDEATVRARLVGDPWIDDGLIQLVSIETWDLLLGRFSVV